MLITLMETEILRKCQLTISKRRGNMKTIIKSNITEALHNIGLESGDTVMVHTSLSQTGHHMIRQLLLLTLWGSL